MNTVGGESRGRVKRIKVLKRNKNNHLKLLFLDALFFALVRFAERPEFLQFYKIAEITKNGSRLLKSEPSRIV